MQWKHAEIGSEAARHIKDSGQSFIVACAHFSQQSRLGLFLPTVLPQDAHILKVMSPRPPHSLEPVALRLRFQYGQWVDVVQGMHQNCVELFFTENEAATAWFPKIWKCLQQPRNVLVIDADTYWANSQRVLRRDFAGLRSFSFAVGTAAIARLAQCPILPCTTFIREDGTIVIEWGTPILPPELTDQGADARITGQLIDNIERAIGFKPEQYVLAIGASRRWNAVKDQWEEYG